MVKKFPVNEKSPVKKYLVLLAFFCILVLSTPLFFAITIRQEQKTVKTQTFDKFPVTVDPKNKLIVEKIEVNEYLEGSATSSPLAASISSAFAFIWNSLKSAVVSLGETPWYHSVASVAGLDGHFVEITPGMRKEQVANTFAKALNWTSKERKEFLTAEENAELPLPEGSYFPDTYFVDDGMTPDQVQDMVNKNFTENVIIRYGTSTQEVVPIEQAINIASIIQRETIGNKDMRLISGILWNRLFNNMKLQVDATLQYAKASKSPNNGWWPDVDPADKYIKSPYNTYQNPGLPPTAIANPSVGAILAALNPIETPCLFYFNDKKGEFHCSETYKEHVNLLRKYY